MNCSSVRPSLRGDEGLEHGIGHVRFREQLALRPLPRLLDQLKPGEGDHVAGFIEHEHLPMLPETQLPMKSERKLTIEIDASEPRANAHPSQSAGSRT